MTVTITEVREEHIAGCNAALDVVAREGKYLVFLEAPPIESTRAFISHSIANRHPHFVALDGERVVGWCDITPRDRPAARHGGVLGIGILPAWRGRGLGRRLMERALQAARTFPLARVELSVRADNDRAIALYRKIGFEVEGRRRRTTLVDGVYYDDIIMALLLEEAPESPVPAGREA
jgi:ribosomal protein S18 acetylase RimI-like enzyme